MAQQRRKYGLLPPFIPRESTRSASLQRYSAPLLYGRADATRAQPQSAGRARARADRVPEHTPVCRVILRGNGVLSAPRTDQPRRRGYLDAERYTTLSGCPGVAYTRRYPPRRDSLTHARATGEPSLVRQTSRSAPRTIPTDSQNRRDCEGVVGGRNG